MRRCKYAVVKHTPDGVEIVSRHVLESRAYEAKRRYERALARQVQVWHTRPLVRYAVEYIGGRDE